MLVVSDSSPINVLVRIGLIEILPQLFEQVVIPTEVARELTHRATPADVCRFIQNVPDWLQIREPLKIEPIGGIDPGEVAAISLAKELRADLLLIDDKAGRRAAAGYQIPTIGTLGVLARAEQRGMVDLKTAIDGLKQIEFFISDELVQSLLRHNRHE